MALSRRLRYEILRRDNHTCRYCGASAPAVPLTVDHVIPVALGGLDDPTNLVTACRDCNSGKAATSPDATMIADVQERALLWAAAMKQAAEERAGEREFHQWIHTWFRARWNRWTWTDARGEKHSVPLPEEFTVSLDRFLNAGLDDGDFDELIDATMTARSSDEWKYFCGCCWRRIRQAQDRAADIVAEVNDRG
ncbi:HNH endonuclease [Gordonia sp. ABKF26]|uniref:HNH endonuclease n=1 Tax=Gordonia sp. ABKF26 TaxID=3238687 RepID=UPI0034E4B36E